MSYRSFIPPGVQEQLDGMAQEIADERGMTFDEARAALAAQDLGAEPVLSEPVDDAALTPSSSAPGAWGTCTCGHPIYTHGRVNLDGGAVWKGCRLDYCDCDLWHASDGSRWPVGEAGIP